MAMSTKTEEQDTKIYKIILGNVYPAYIKKAERKGHTKEEVDEIIFWLTGYGEKDLERHIELKSDLESFFRNAPRFNPNASKITGVICGIRVEEIADEITQKIRYLDKMIDELAKGKAMDKIKRR